MYCIKDIEDSIDFEEIIPLPFTMSGYEVMPTNSPDIIDRLNFLDSFLIEHLEDVYLYSALKDEVESITSQFKRYELLQNQNEEAHIKAVIIFRFIIDEVLPSMTPNESEFRIGRKSIAHGFYPELPKHSIVKGSKEEFETIALIKESSVFAKLLFVADNKKSDGLRNIQPGQLDTYCIKIVADNHFVPFQRSLHQAKRIHNMGEHLAGTNTDIVDFVIDKMFFQIFKDSLEAHLGSDMTQLWHDITNASYETTELINGINLEDTYYLRETCSECEELEVETARYENKNCSCCSMDTLNNVWAIKDSYFWKALEKQGAMLYETDSLYLYFQTDYTGYQHDSYLRQAWLSLHLWNIKPVLSQSVFIDDNKG